MPPNANPSPNHRTPPTPSAQPPATGPSPSRSASSGRKRSSGRGSARTSAEHPAEQPIGRRGRRLVRRVAGRMVAGGLVLALAPVAGLAALAGMALVGAGPEVFTVVGLAVFASVLFLGLLLCVPRPHVAWGRWSRAVLVLGVEAAAVWQVSALTLNPLAVPPAPAGVAGQREWRLPTGSRLAYVRIAPERVTRPEPVVFLHGGPGVGDLEGDSAFYGRLASAGFEVYVYDQLGAGRSARLADPRGYGLARDVADLEAIRRTVRAGRLNLVARDYGAQLAAAYLAAHPGQVARAVLYSPTGLTPARAPSRIATSAIPLGPGALPHPRTLAVSALLRVDPATARAFAGDRELDAHLALLLRNQAAPACPAPAPGPGHGGYVALAGRTTPASLRNDLVRTAVPVLIVKGACDAEPWSDATAYRRTLPDTRLAYVGNAAPPGRTDAYLDVLRTFLTGGEPNAYPAEEPPPGYRGPS
ncbi:alpha/beta fold hydrolase [Nonomuraea rubra]|uniref:prolyl aminopeptidase n=1 Tax=Nonomuraea rubra TaxID=46180 RepID=A0A7X0NYV3_9ACTN|nr:alpha/beta hydrolase [Nonomuraea rubra]MBB6552159.1 proline iminopeptidase [Nonomuraea rubra]